MKDREYGSFILRFFATVFDHLLLWLIPLVLVFINTTVSKNTNDFWLGSLWTIWEILFLQWIISYLYHIVTFLTLGGSIGKLLAGLHIELEDGQKPRLFDALMRFPVGYTVSSLFWCWGYFWVLVDPLKKGFHDHFAGTVVVKKSSSLPLLIFLPLLLLVMSILFTLIIVTGLERGLWSALGND
jgi:uncharacterized RDD family membrane protein YckC